MKVAAAVAALLGASLLMSLALAVPAAVVLMWLFGALNHAISPAIPLPGYAACYPIALFAFWFWNLLTVNSHSSSSS